MSIIPYVYVPIRKHTAARKGLAERVLRKRLERAGWRVWRGGYLHASRKPELYPVVERAYKELTALLDTHYAAAREHLQYLCVVHHGMPDLICYRQGVFKFVECKLEHEQLLQSQKQCIPKLLALGLSVEVHKLVGTSTKVREALVNIESGEKRIADRQLTLSQALAKKRIKKPVLVCEITH
jgi:hypothetical protein